MWNENTLKELVEIYKEVSFEKIAQLWKKNEAPVGVYIHNPFCSSECSFCAYKGRVPLRGELEKYYEHYLPAQITSYTEILQKVDIVSWFFGGGTPSLMSPTILRNILSLLPKIKDIGEKTFELHPAGFCLELLDVLQEYNFCNVIIGVQSFNNSALKASNRAYVSKEKIQEIVQEIQKRKMLAWIDLVGFMNDVPQEIRVLGEDIYTALELNPDEISICINYYYRKKYLDAVADLLTTVVSSISRNYYIPDLRQPSSFAIRALLQKNKVFRILNNVSYKKTLASSRFIATMDTADLLTYGLSRLGIGSYKNQEQGTMSCVVTPEYNYHYTEVNESFVPRYFITHTANFLKEALNLISELTLLTNKTNHCLKIEQLTINNLYGDDFGLAKDIPQLDVSINTRSFGDTIKNETCKKILDSYFHRPVRPFIDLSNIS